MKRGTKAIIAVFLIMQLVLSLGAGAVFAQSNSDIKGHWAEDKITQWLDKGLVNGYPDGSFKPNKTVTRAEFVKTVNQVFRVSMNTDVNLSFADLPEKHWAYEEVKAAVGQGYVNGVTATTFAPNQAVTRQEAAVMLTSLLKLTGEEANVTFKDANQVSSWAKDAVDALVKKGILNGDNNGNVNPRQPLTRAEAVILLSNASDNTETVLSAAGTYGNEDKQTIIEGNVRITSTGVKLLNTKITGNLVIDKAVGEGDVYLNKVEVQGDTLVQGGGENSIHVEDSIIVRIIADKVTGKVRIVAIGSTSVYEVIVQSSIKLEELKTTGSGFNKVELSSTLPVGSSVDLVGNFESVSLLASSIKVSISSGSVNEMNVSEQAANTAVTLDKDAKIINLLLNIAAQLLGEGTIEKATIGENAGESSFTQAPKKVEGNESKIIILPPVTLPPSMPPISDGDGGKNQTPPPTTKSSDATLHSLVIESDSELVLKKNALLLTSDLPVDGFLSSYYSYTAYIPNGAETYDITLNLSHHAAASVSVYHNDGAPLTKNAQGKYSIRLKSNQDNNVSVWLHSEDGKYSKSYEFYFVPELVDLQKSFKIVQSNNEFYMIPYNLLIEDKIIVTIPAVLTSLNEELVVNEEVPNYSGYYPGTQSNIIPYIYLRKFVQELNKFSPTSNTGSINIQIIRDGKVVANGEYIFDVTPLTIDVLDDSAMDFEFLTTEQIAQEDASSGLDFIKHVISYNIELDLTQLESLYGEFAYLYMDYHDSENTTIIKDQTKILDHSEYVSKESIQTYKRSFGHFYDPSTGLAEDGFYYTSLSQINILVTLYDNDKNPIKAFSIVKPIPESALGPNVKFQY